MKFFAAVLVLCVASASAAVLKDKTEDEFFTASAACAKKLQIDDSHLAKFQELDYPNDKTTQEFLHCLWTGMDLFNDEIGYNVENIAFLYKDKANSEVLIPILSECNKKEANDSTLSWLYRGFQCIMSSKVGQWFKEDIAKKQAALAASS
ncbi:general odorant-binding protein 99a-like [Episyrphus balteatus]|uniref:general odorant-binding protein 99a-like n=1 Tax=Episyrphus balteatus TaxID=286459 RepID=UPI002484F3C8|nr:general odorant-binding protein 99a-like [Episyrphus balteatus]